MDILNKYKEITNKLGHRITLLNIDNDNLSFVFGNIASPDIIKTSIGLGNVSKFFHHLPPTPSELEYAINNVEDVIVPLYKMINHNSQLLSVDKGFDSLINAYDSSAQRPFNLSAEMLETVFSRFGFIVSGRPAITDNLPDDAEFAIRLLLLRESLHHLKFNDILLL